MRIDENDKPPATNTEPTLEERIADRKARQRRPPLVRLASAPVRALPDLIIVGAQRAGSTSLFLYLCEHPLVVAGRRKEIHFFDRHRPIFSWWYRAHFPLRSELNRMQRENGHLPLTLDATPSYLFRPYAAARMAAVVPKAKLIALVRDPAKRALSHYRAKTVWLKVGGEEPQTLSFEESVDEALRWFADPSSKAVLDNQGAPYPANLLDRGRYGTQIERVLKHFPREQLLVIRSEDMYADPARVHAEALEFLGLPVQLLSSYQVPNPWTKGATMEEETRQRLAEFFRPENERLSELLGREFDWT